MTEAEVDAVVIGGGVVGLAVAGELAGAFPRVMLLERGPRLGEGASTRNSGVIHSGIYYPPGSLKARLCVEGARRLYAWCEAHSIPHRRCGKVVVAATPGEVPAIERLRAQGEANGVPGLRMLDAEGLKRVEPEVAGAAALHVPGAGILDAAELVRSLASWAAERGVEVLTQAEVIGIKPAPGGIGISSSRGPVCAARVVNCAGLYADRVARMSGAGGWRIHPCRGEYCEVRPSRAGVVRGLVYPAPHPGPGLGVHLTPTVHGALLVGPNARYVERPEDYEAGRAPVSSFLEPARRLLPALTLEDLRPGYAGVRAKLSPEGDSGFHDFVMSEDPGCAGILHLLGIESPGLTAALALAREVAGRLPRS